MGNKFIPLKIKTKVDYCSAHNVHLSGKAQSLKMNILSTSTLPSPYSSQTLYRYCFSV